MGHPHQYPDYPGYQEQSNSGESVKLELIAETDS